MTVAQRSSEPLVGQAPAVAEPLAALPVDAREFARLFATHAPRVWRMLRRLGVGEPDLEDVCQEVFLVVYRRWGEFRGDSSISTWILGIALRKALTHRRRKHTREATPLTEAHEPACAPEQQRGLEREDARLVLEQALQKLGDAQRDVFVLFELEQLSMRDVAAALELPLPTAYARLYAARAELAAELRRLAARGAMP